MVSSKKVILAVDDFIGTGETWYAPIMQLGSKQNFIYLRKINVYPSKV